MTHPAQRSLPRTTHNYRQSEPKGGSVILAWRLLAWWPDSLSAPALPWAAHASPCTWPPGRPRVWHRLRTSRRRRSPLLVDRHVGRTVGSEGRVAPLTCATVPRAAGGAQSGIGARVQAGSVPKVHTGSRTGLLRTTVHTQLADDLHVRLVGAGSTSSEPQPPRTNTSAATATRRSSSDPYLVGSHQALQHDAARKESKRTNQVKQYGEIELPGTVRTGGSLHQLMAAVGEVLIGTLSMSISGRKK